MVGLAGVGINETSVCQIIDPFVEVEIIGLPVDCCKEQTRVVDDNGEYAGVGSDPVTTETE